MKRYLIFWGKAFSLASAFLPIATEVEEPALCSIIQVFLEKAREISPFLMLPATSAVITVFGVWSS